MNLYNITEEYLDLQDELLAAGGEFTEDMEARLAINEDEFEAKAESYAKVIGNLDAYADACRNEEQRMAAKRRSAEKASERMRKAMASAMDLRGMDKFSAGAFKLSWRKVTSVEINPELDLRTLPEDYVRVEYKADKLALKEALKSGNTIEGVTLAEKRNLQIK